MAWVGKRSWMHEGKEKSAYVVRYVDGGGAKRQKTFTRKKDADAFAFQIETDIQKGVVLPTSADISIKRICDDFLRDAEDRQDDGRIGINRLRSLKMCVDKSIIPRLGKIKITSLTVDAVLTFYRDLRKIDGLAVRTAKDRVYNLLLVEEFARRRSLTNGQPVRDALKQLRGTAPSIVRTFDADEVSNLLATAETKGTKLKARSAAMVRCLIHLAAFCGLRFGEIMALSQASVDLDRRVIRVRQSLLFNDILKGPKTRAGNRDIPIPLHVVDLMKDWNKNYKVEEKRGLIFRTATGGAVSNMNFHRQWKDLLMRAGLSHEKDGFHFHALRHFCASWWIESGMSLMDVASLLGHSKFDMTLQVYAHPVTRERARHAAVDAAAARMRTPALSILTQDSRISPQVVDLVAAN